MNKNLNFEAEIFSKDKLQTLYHIGSMDIGDKDRFFKDGNGLSVSICPDIWSKMLNTSSETIYKFNKKDIKLLDYYSLTKNDLDLATDWGVAEGYLEKSDIYSFESNECSGETILCDSFEDAQKKANFYRIYKDYDEYLKYGNAENSYVERNIGYLPTKKLKTISMVNVDAYNAVNINLLIFLEKNTNLDGVYWDDIMDVKNEIAPRGVIFNSKVSLFKSMKFYLCDKCKTNIAEYKVLEEKLCNNCKEDKYGKDILNEETGNYKCSICSGEYFYGFGKCNCYEYIAK